MPLNTITEELHKLTVRMRTRSMNEGLVLGGHWPKIYSAYQVDGSW